MKKKRNCPINQIRAAARNVPQSFTEELREKGIAVETVRIEEFIFHNGYWNQSGSDIRTHLARCGSCRRVFNRILNDRPPVRRKENRNE